MVKRPDVSSKKNSGKYFPRAGETHATANYLSENRAQGMDSPRVVGPLAAPPARTRSFGGHRQKIYPGGCALSCLVRARGAGTPPALDSDPNCLDRLPQRVAT